ncbi:MAG: tetratricopeptide repeat protein [Usitatibacter sp.]
MRAGHAVLIAAAIAAAACAPIPAADGFDMIGKGNMAGGVNVIRQDAEAGNVDSQKMMGAILEGGILGKDGPGIAANPREALKWYERAAQSGDKEALKRMGILYALGRGTPKDPDKALETFRRAGVGVDDILAENPDAKAKNLSKEVQAWMVAFNVELSTRVSKYPRESVRRGDRGSVLLQVDTATRAVEIVGGDAPEPLKAVVRETAARSLILAPPPDEAANAGLKTRIEIIYRLS